MPALRPDERPLLQLPTGLSRVKPELYTTIFADVAARSRVVLTRIDETADLPQHASNPGFLGPGVCAECHADYYESCRETAHFRTASAIDADSDHPLSVEVPPRIESGDARLWYRIDEKDGQLFQTVVVDEAGDHYAGSFPVSLTTGSGRHGQTYLSWQGDGLFELPVSYVTPQDAFTHSPGYQRGVANFARPIGPRCLECHTTWFAKVKGAFNRYAIDSAIVGVTCEVCHGPGKAHVAFHRKQPNETEPRHITNPHDLPRERLVDLCSLCHGGGGTRLQAEFSFRPGDKLEAHLKLANDVAEHGVGGVHAANQAARLGLSRCFQMSQMSCTDCHDLHTPEGPPASFARNCLTCHEVERCSEVVRLGASFSDRCVECHMPLRGDDETRFHTDAGDFVPALRDHFISVWPDIAEAVSGK